MLSQRFVEDTVDQPQMGDLSCFTTWWSPVLAEDNTRPQGDSCGCLTEQQTNHLKAPREREPWYARDLKIALQVVFILKWITSLKDDSTLDKGPFFLFLLVSSLPIYIFISCLLPDKLLKAQHPGEIAARYYSPCLLPLKHIFLSEK